MAYDHITRAGKQKVTLQDLENLRELMRNQGAYNPRNRAVDSKAPPFNLAGAYPAPVVPPRSMDVPLGPVVPPRSMDGPLGPVVPTGSTDGLLPPEIIQNLLGSRGSQGSQGFQVRPGLQVSPGLQGLQGLQGLTGIQSSSVPTGSMDGPNYFQDPSSAPSMEAIQDKLPSKHSVSRPIDPKNSDDVKKAEALQAELQKRRAESEAAENKRSEAGRLLQNEKTQRQMFKNIGDYLGMIGQSRSASQIRLGMARRPPLFTPESYKEEIRDITSTLASMGVEVPPGARASVLRELIGPLTDMAKEKQSMEFMAQLGPKKDKMSQVYIKKFAEGKSVQAAITKSFGLYDAAFKKGAIGPIRSRWEAWVNSGKLGDTKDAARVFFSHLDIMIADFIFSLTGKAAGEVERANYRKMFGKSYESRGNFMAAMASVEGRVISNHNILLQTMIDGGVDTKNLKLIPRSVYLSPTDGGPPVRVTEEKAEKELRKSPRGWEILSQ